MRILINIGHPAHVHLFKNLIWKLEKKGHECKITTVDKDVSLQLLKAYGFDYELVGSAKPSLFYKAIELIKIERKLYNITKSFKPDILIHGHIHEAAGTEHFIGKTRVINAGRKGTIIEV